MSVEGAEILLGDSPFFAVGELIWINPRDTRFGTVDWKVTVRQGCVTGGTIVFQSDITTAGFEQVAVPTDSQVEYASLSVA